MTDAHRARIRFLSVFIGVWIVAAQIWYYAQFRSLLEGLLRAFVYR